MLRAFGWKVAGHSPQEPRCVLIVAPHTSNWDFPYGLAAKWALGLRVRFIGKHTLFRFPLGIFMRALGGIPIDRSATAGVVENCVALFEAQEALYLVIAPEGTRRKTPEWKSGFHRIAVAAGVPILPVVLDYRAREVRLEPFYRPTGDYAKDLVALGAHYAPEMAYRPENYSPPLPG
jgi:1-acyl-sn-glycerol-3-phosphate acyltransferase